MMNFLQNAAKALGADDDDETDFGNLNMGLGGCFLEH